MKNWKKSIAFFLGGQTLSLFGSSLVQYAMMWHLTLDTKSGAVMTGYIIAGFLPGLFLSPFGGVWADRYNRKKIIAAADSFIALVSAAAAVCLFSGIPAIPLFYTAAALRSAGGAFHQPAVGAFLPRLVPTEHLTRMNGINGSIQSALMIVSPIAAGALLAAIPMPILFFIDTATAAAGISLLLLFVHEQPEQTGEALDPAPDIVQPTVKPRSMSSDFIQGLRYIRAHRFLVSFFIFNGLLLFFVSPSAFLTPLQTARTFGPEVWRLTAIEITFSAGMMIGGALIAVFSGLKNKMKTIAASTAVMAVCSLGLAFSPLLIPSAGPHTTFIMYLAFMTIFGISLPYLNTPATVMLQENIENEYMGRVFSVHGMIAGSLMPAAMLIFGPLADILKVEVLLAASGILMLLLAVLLPLNKKLMKAGEKKQ